MLGNFSYCNPTRLYFGEDSMNHFKKELEHYGGNVLLCYGGGSIKKNGIYDQVIAVLKECGKTVMEDPGVMPNPTVEKLREGIQRGGFDSRRRRRFGLRLRKDSFRISSL